MLCVTVQTARTNGRGLPLRSVCSGNTGQHPANILGFEYTGMKGAGGGLHNRGGAG